MHTTSDLSILKYSKRDGMSDICKIFAGLAFLLHSFAASSGQLVGKESFPNTPYVKRWVGLTGNVVKAPSKNQERLLYNPICVDPDQPCNGDGSNPGGGDARDYMESLGYVAVGDSPTVELERVTVYVKRFDYAWELGNTGLCINEECRTYNLLLPVLAEESSKAVGAVVVAAITDNVELLFPLLDKCVKTPIVNERVRSPDADMIYDYYLARDSIGQTYAGNTSVLRAGMRVDVAYPVGQTVRFIIYSVDYGQQPVVTSLGRFLDGIPNPQNTPCK
nr:hypothetical protein [uncultured Roseateles sp.]